MKMKKGTRGFTLIELLVVIAIIGILSAVVLTSLSSAREKARDARRVSDIKQIQLALELAYDTDGSYPATATWDTTVANYMATVPTDPTTSAAYTYELNGSSYVIMAVLEGDNSVLDTDVDGTVGTTDCADATFNYCVTP